MTSIADAARGFDGPVSKRVGVGGVGRAGGSDGGTVLFGMAVINVNVAMGTIGGQTHLGCSTIHSRPLQPRCQHLSIVNGKTDIPLLSLCWGFQICNIIIKCVARMTWRICA